MTETMGAVTAIADVNRRQPSLHLDHVRAPTLRRRHDIGRQRLQQAAWFHRGQCRAIQHCEIHGCHQVSGQHHLLDARVGVDIPQNREGVHYEE
jgi:hypothetical protein